MNRRYLYLILVAVTSTIIFLVTWFSLFDRSSQPPGGTGVTIEKMLDQRAKLDEIVWQDEVLAQEYEEPFIQLWDRLRESDNKLQILSELPFEALELGKQSSSDERELGIQVIHLGGKGRVLTHEDWKSELSRFQSQGFEVIQTEWHHSRFEPGPPARSTVAMVLHVANLEKDKFYVVRGDLAVEWQPRKDGKDAPRPRVIRANDLRIVHRSGPPGFKRAFSAPSPALPPSLHVYDLNRDGLSDIVLPRSNRVFWNRGKFNFDQEKLLPQLKRPSQSTQTSLLADFNGDGRADLLCAGQNLLTIHLADENGAFTKEDNVLPNVARQLKFVVGLTAGDIDGDNDLDLWVTQYRLPYDEGSRPNPYYDANDGFPSFLLVNKGDGTFDERTEAAGLTKKRHRRTYGGSFVDLDRDADLDLLVVSDFAGLDVYENNGNGQFTDVTDRFGDDRHSFGMSVTFGDYNGDDLLDFYFIGMSSTTARRLERLGLGRKEHPEHQRMRTLMGYGNRMFLGTGGQRFQVAPFNDDVARTGWSWGSTSFDFDNDADTDLYVANGHLSGKTAKDYCSQFWCHDIYPDFTQPSKTALQFTQLTTFKKLQSMSWNGFEHNALLMNQAQKGFLNVGFLMRVAFEWDSRNVVGHDLDADGRPDLVVVARAPTEGPGRLLVLQNVLETSNHWIGMRLHEQGGGLSPIGAKVVVITKDGRKRTAQLVTGDSYLSQHPNTVHFGLGKESSVRALEIHWPNGTVQRLKSPAVNRYHEAPAQPE